MVCCVFIWVWHHFFCLRRVSWLFWLGLQRSCKVLLVAWKFFIISILSYQLYWSRNMKDFSFFFLSFISLIFSHFHNEDPFFEIGAYCYELLNTAFAEFSKFWYVVLPFSYVTRNFFISRLTYCSFSSVLLILHVFTKFWEFKLLIFSFILW